MAGGGRMRAARRGLRALPGLILRPARNGKARPTGMFNGARAEASEPAQKKRLQAGEARSGTNGGRARH